MELLGRSVVLVRLSSVLCILGSLFFFGSIQTITNRLFSHFNIRPIGKNVAGLPGLASCPLFFPVQQKQQKEDLVGAVAVALVGVGRRPCCRLSARWQTQFGFGRRVNLRHGWRSKS
ncbi:hypothetical protein TW95_gp0557 [Pandoravirus inopinatum]|uniref:Uncharacterized protein n=1 Tax=Pandoravirus inopinatum TaxID=1605721 RepID=A0A0B5J911_9VIRU|nr:hypothetical protein TW95_gp0557 [Pandoravirus inopinatum]AJF97291.1 hypothetical protein [Pandoravirus inopinatum]